MTSYKPVLLLDERIFILSKTYQSILQYFAHWEDADVQPDQLDDRFKSFLPRVVATDDRRDFALLMAEFLSPLNNGHTGYADLDLLGEVSGLDFSMEYRTEGWVVRESANDQMIPGDLVVAVDHQPVEEWYQETKKYTCVRSEVARRWAFQTYLALMLREPEIHVSWEDRLGQQRESGVRRTVPLWSPCQAVPTEGRWLDGEAVAYIKIHSFGKCEYEEAAVKYVQEFGSARTLIIDVRGNTGGSTPERLVPALMDRRWRWGMSSSPLQVGVLSYWASQGSDYDVFRDSRLLWGAPYQEPQSAAYGGRVIILVDRYTGSAAEDFVMPFRDNGRAVLVGERTWGSTGQPYYYEFEQGISLRVSAKRDYMPNGSRFEGLGIAPDVEVDKAREDYYERRDRAMEKALELSLQ